MATEAKPRRDGDGVPWCDLACPFWNEGTDDAECADTEENQVCPVAVRALARELAEIRAAAGEESPLELIAAAKRLPLTKDGVRMVPGGHYWGWCHVGVVRGGLVARRW